MILDHSALLHIFNAKGELPTLRLIEVLSQYTFKVKFMEGEGMTGMTVSDFLFRHPVHDLASHTNCPFSCKEGCFEKTKN